MTTLLPFQAVREVRPVGSYSKGTMLTKSNVADLVVVLATVPTGAVECWKGSCSLEYFCD